MNTKKGGGRASQLRDKAACCRGHHGVPLPKGGLSTYTDGALAPSQALWLLSCAREQQIKTKTPQDLLPMFTEN